LCRKIFRCKIFDHFHRITLRKIYIDIYLFDLELKITNDII
jgi:hypothetical protein